ncbi:hypothetical protein FBU59_006967, partial [Linderina macrospora]
MPVSGFGDGPININFRQQLQVSMLTADTCVAIEVFGTAQPLVLRRAFQEDVQIEQTLRGTSGTTLRGSIGQSSVSSLGNGSMSASQNLLVERLHEEELFVDSQHELMMWVRMQELDQDGEWDCAPCIKTAPSPAFILRQGLQRRVEITIAHNASQHLVITGVDKVSIGCPTLVNSKGIVVSSSQRSLGVASRMVVVPVGLIELAGENTRLDNRCFAKVVLPWDTSIYMSRLLDTPTNHDERVRLTLSLRLLLERGSEPLELTTDIFVQMHGRQSSVGRSWLSNIAENASSFFGFGSSHFS